MILLLATRNWRLAFALLAAASVMVPIASGQAAKPIDIGEFRHLILELSEPEGYFDTDNLISNESAYLRALPSLERLGIHGGVYIGVGPDQNFSYIAAIHPALAIIIDIRRQNALQHLYFKALFHLSGTRIEFLERLFGRQLGKEAKYSASCKIAEVLEEITAAKPDKELAERNVAEACRVLRGWNLSLGAEDFEAIRHVANAFIDGGPDLKFSSYNRPANSYYPTYRTLLTGTDASGVPASYLATEISFRLIKQLQESNLIIPIVGDLAGAQALRSVALELRRRHLEVACLYVSNVEYYLFGGAGWAPYVGNLKALPIARESYIIRSYANSRQPHPAQRPGHYMTTILESIRTFLDNEANGKHGTYWDLVTHDSIFP